MEAVPRKTTIRDVAEARASVWDDFARAEFQFASQQGDAGARPESNSATRVSAQCAGRAAFCGGGRRRSVFC